MWLIVPASQRVGPHSEALLNVLIHPAVPPLLGVIYGLSFFFFLYVLLFKLLQRLAVSTAAERFHFFLLLIVSL